MSGNDGLCTRLLPVMVLAALLLVAASAFGATPLQILPTNSLVNGPPYPTGALTADIVLEQPGTPPVALDRMSSSVKILNPIGATDWFIADSFGFGVEREMKESGEKGGTEDINIGVGELQECTISKSMDRASTKLAQFAINGYSLRTAEIFFVEIGGSGGRIRYISEFTTPQPATFTNLSIVPGADGHSFDLNFALLYHAPYDPELSILTEVMTGDFTPIPEPASMWLLVCASAASSFSRRFRRR